MVCANHNGVTPRISLHGKDERVVMYACLMNNLTIISCLLNIQQDMNQQEYTE